jgi:hypothetical protein
MVARDRRPVQFPVKDRPLTDADDRWPVTRLVVSGATGAELVSPRDAPTGPMQQSSRTPGHTRGSVELAVALRAE